MIYFFFLFSMRTFSIPDAVDRVRSGWIAFDRSTGYVAELRTVVVVVAGGIFIICMFDDKY